MARSSAVLLVNPGGFITGGGVEVAVGVVAVGVPENLWYWVEVIDN